MNDILEAWEAARLLGVSTFTITNKYIKSGLLPATKENTHQGRGHTKWFIRRSDVEALRFRRLAGEFKPGPNGSKDQPLITIRLGPDSDEKWSKIKLLTVQERGVILAHYARMKEDDPVRFEAELSQMNGDDDEADSMFREHQQTKENHRRVYGE